MCCRQLSLTNPVATADGRNYPSHSMQLNFSMLKIWWRQNNSLWFRSDFVGDRNPHFFDVSMPCEAVCSRFEVITVLLVVVVKQPLTTKQRQVTSNLEPWRHIAASNEIVTTLVQKWLASTCGIAAVVCDGLRLLRFVHVSSILRLLSWVSDTNRVCHVWCNF